MRFLIQRVKEAKVEVEGTCIGSIHKGFLVFIGICDTDTTEIADKLIRKLIGLRIFSDENDKINLDLKSVDGELLLVSQFTLYADCKKGNRPSFTKAMNPKEANTLYEYIVNALKTEVTHVETGSFGADMKVSLLNDGPFTVLLDSAEIC